jgi:hypothetical protein
LDSFKIGPSVPRLLSRFDQDAQASIYQLPVQQEPGSCGVPDAGFHSNSFVGQQSKDLSRSGFVKIDRSEVR